MEFAREQERMLQMMGLDQDMQGLMMRAMPGVCTRADTDALLRLQGAYRVLQTSALSTDVLVTAEMLRQRLADVTEWTARAFDSRNEPADALAHYQKARELHAALQDSGAVARIDDKIGEIRLQGFDGLDGELVRLRQRLEDRRLDAFDRAKGLVQLGELLSKAGDDFEAERVLLEAERLLSATPNLGRDDLLARLAESVKVILDGSASSGAVPIVRAMELRALYQRLYFALGNACRDTDPERAQAYEKLLDAFDRAGGGADQAVIEQLMEQLARLHA